MRLTSFAIFDSLWTTGHNLRVANKVTVKTEVVRINTVFVREINDQLTITDICFLESYV